MPRERHFWIVFGPSPRNLARLEAQQAVRPGDALLEYAVAKERVALVKREDEGVPRVHVGRLFDSNVLKVCEDLTVAFSRESLESPVTEDRTPPETPDRRERPRPFDKKRCAPRIRSRVHPEHLCGCLLGNSVQRRLHLVRLLD
jgi:hypothetical protein